MLRTSLARLPGQAGSEVAACVCLGAAGCYLCLEEPTSALDCIDRGLQLDSKNTALLTLKGCLLYGEDSDKAVSLLRKAARHGSDAFWTHFFVAHYYLKHNRFDECRTWAEKSLAKSLAKTHDWRAEILQWLAICAANSSMPFEQVLSLFDQAFELDSSNPRIANNRAVLLSHRSSFALSCDQWDVISESELKTCCGAEFNRLSDAEFTSNPQNHGVRSATQN